MEMGITPRNVFSKSKGYNVISVCIFLIFPYKNGFLHLYIEQQGAAICPEVGREITPESQRGVASGWLEEAHIPATRDSLYAFATGRRIGLAWRE